jgi:AcrR family transcriptional regulator
MPRWEPNAAERLAQAALDLFAERGYENTTVIDIAQHAGLGKTTFFRHFRDKREVLFGEEAMSALLGEAITTAPVGARPLDAVARAFEAVGREAFTPESRARVARRRAVITANPELQERETLKRFHLIAAMTDALVGRGNPDLTARVAAQLGALALDIAYDRWAGSTDGDGFGDLARQALAELRTAATDC